MKKILSIVPALMLLSACASLGSDVGPKASVPTLPRATDQEVLADAIDLAFQGLKMPGFAAADGGPLSGQVSVEAVEAIPEEIRRYAAGKATIAAGQSGIAIFEPRRILDRRPNGDWSLLIEEPPETDARVVVTITYAGVDHLRERIPTRTPEVFEALVGRFKATVAVVPRNAKVTPFSQVISGERRFDLDQGKYVDVR